MNPREWETILDRVFEKRITEFLIGAAIAHKSETARHVKIPSDVLVAIAEQVVRAFTPPERK